MPIHRFKPVKVEPKSAQEVMADAGVPNMMAGRKISINTFNTRAEDKKPLPPEILADAIQDKAHKDIGIGRAAKSTKVKTSHPEVHGSLEIAEEEL